VFRADLTRCTRKNEVLSDNKLHSVCYQNRASRVILCCDKIHYCDMTVKVGVMEGEEAVIDGQVHDKHVSAAIDPDATVQDAVFSMRAFLATALCTRVRNDNSQQYTKRFLSGPLLVMWRGRAWTLAVEVNGPP
jgi:hypothetical protein